MHAQARNPTVGTEAPDQGRIKTLDALRGLASLTVCWFHLTNGQTAGSWLQWSGSYGWLGVEAFFVISGFVIPFSMLRGGYAVQHNWSTFLWKRILRIDPPYLVAAAMCLTLWYVSASTPGFAGKQSGPTPAAVALHLGYLNGLVGEPWLNPVFWTLAIEFQFYLLVSLAFPLLAAAGWRSTLTTAAACIVAPLVVPSNNLVFHYLPLFLLGILAFRYRTGQIAIHGLTIILGVACVCIHHVLGMAVMLAGLAASLVLLVDWKREVPKALIFLGTISYSLYLVHVPIGGRVVNLGRRFVDSAPGEWAVSALALAVSITTATLFWRLVESPAQRWASRWHYK